MALVMIVKDERARIERCLASARPHINHFTICDTGSTDGTPELVRRALDGIPGKLPHHAWVNFGANRSRAFKAARGTADWLLALDADMTVAIDPGFEPDPTVEAYMIEMGGAAFSWRLPLLLRGDLPWQSVGACHEYTVRADGVLGRREPTDAVRVTHSGAAATPEKLRWHARLLEAELRERPDDPRTLFYLAQTYRDLGEPRAWALYRRRVVLSGWPEETFYAAFQAAFLTPGWHDRQAALIAAWEMRPHRLEPLHALVKELNERDQHATAYWLSRVPIEPTTDALFVHRDVWDWGMTFQRSIAAWWVERRDESAALSEQLLANPRLPEHIRAAVERNLALSADRGSAAA